MFLNLLSLAMMKTSWTELIIVCRGKLQLTLTSRCDCWVNVMLAPCMAVFQHHIPAYGVIPKVVPVNLTEYVDHTHNVSYTLQIFFPTFFFFSFLFNL